MHKLSFQILDFAIELPDEWDSVSNSIFQRKLFLQHCENYNPCKQRYYVLFENGLFKAGAIVYTLDIHLFTFSQIPSQLKMQVIGVPASISASGLVGSEKYYIEILIKEIFKLEKGLIVGLNTETDIRPSSALILNMLPTLELKRSFHTWDEYFESLRSSYRRRSLQIVEHFNGINKIITRCDTFSNDHYELYLQIMKHTPSKLEVLTLDFFKNMPSEFLLSSYYDEDSLICWNITCNDENKFYFFFGGHDYDALEYYQSYFNNLFGVLENAINAGYNIIDFGQTAEFAKMKIGAEVVEKQLFLFHKNRWILQILRMFSSLIDYKPVREKFHVFNEKHNTSKSNIYENSISKTRTTA